METHADFLGAAYDLASKLQRTPDEEALRLRFRATALIRRFGKWASNQPSPGEKAAAVGELLSLNREVNEYLLRRKAGV